MIGSCDFKMLSLNVRGLSNSKKRHSIFAWCRKQKANIISLQETHSMCNREKQWKAEWGEWSSPMGAAMQEVLRYYYEMALIVK